MNKEEIIKLYIEDLNTKVPKSSARDNRISMLELELSTPSEREEIKRPNIKDYKSGEWGECIHDLNSYIDYLLSTPSERREGS